MFFFSVLRANAVGMRAAVLQFGGSLVVFVV
jgi:hypothetical protein